VNLDDPAIYEQLDPGGVRLTLAGVADYLPITPAATNPAKRIAGQLIERLPILHGIDYSLETALHWQKQLNSFGKHFAMTQSLTDLAAYGIDGLFFPQNLTSHATVLILSIPAAESAEDIKLMTTARELYMHMGIAVDVIAGQGDNVLAQTLALTHLGDYVAYYVAIANGVDPAIRPATTEFQTRLAHPPNSL
jgi:glucose/mannose-6-phosphate isomerase